MKRKAIIIAIGIVAILATKAVADSTTGYAYVCNGASSGRLCLPQFPLLNLYGTNGVGFVGTSTTTATKYGVGSGTGTGTGTGAGTWTRTATGTATDTSSASDTFTIFGNAQTNTITVTTTATSTTVRTQTFTLVGGFAHTPTNTKTAVMSGTATTTSTATITATATVTATITATDSTTCTGTVTTTATFTTTSTATSLQSSTMGGIATNTTTWSNYGTYTVTGTWAQTASSTGTGTRTLTVLLTQTGTSSITKTGTTSLTLTGTTTATGTDSVTGSGTATGYAAGTFTATALGTSTSATTVSSPTITYSPPSVPGGDLYLVNGIINTGVYPAPAFVTFPAGDVGTSDLNAHPTSSTPDKLTTLCDNTVSAGSNNGNCSIVNHWGVHSEYTWIPPGNVVMNLWARSALSNAAQIKLFFATCTGGNATGEVSFPTITVNVTTDAWQLLQATLPLPTGLLLKPDYQFCVSASAYTGGVLADVYLGAIYPHYSSINGPWAGQQRIEYPPMTVTPGMISGSVSAGTGAPTTVYTYPRSLKGAYRISATWQITNTGGVADTCNVELMSNSSAIDLASYTLAAGATTRVWIDSGYTVFAGTETIALKAYAGTGTCGSSTPGGSQGGEFAIQALPGWIR